MTLQHPDLVLAQPRYGFLTIQRHCLALRMRPAWEKASDLDSYYYLQKLPNNTRRRVDTLLMQVFTSEL